MRLWHYSLGTRYDSFGADKNADSGSAMYERWGLMVRRALRKLVATCTQCGVDASFIPTRTLAGVNMMLIHLRARDGSGPSQSSKFGDGAWYMLVVNAVTCPRFASSGFGSLMTLASGLTGIPEPSPAVSNAYEP